MRREAAHGDCHNVFMLQLENASKDEFAIAATWSPGPSKEASCKTSSCPSHF